MRASLALWLIAGLAAGCSPEPCGGLVCPVTLASGQRPGPIAVDGTSVYWGNYDGNNTVTTATLMKVPVEGGSPIALAASPYWIDAIALDETSVYWTTLNFTTTSGAVMKVPREGGTATTLASFTSLGEVPLPIAIDGTSAYWAYYRPDYGGTVASVPLAGGSVATLVSGQEDITALAVDGTNIYWATTSTDVRRVPLPGGTWSTVATLPGSRLGDFAVDATSAYWTQWNHLGKVGLDSGTVTILLAPTA